MPQHVSVAKANPQSLPHSPHASPGTDPASPRYLALPASVWGGGAVVVGRRLPMMTAQE